MDTLSKPLLGDESFADAASISTVGEKPPLTLQRRPVGMRRWWQLPLLVHLGLLTAYIFVTITIVLLAISSKRHGPGLIYSCVVPTLATPAQRSIKPGIYFFNASQTPPLYGNVRISNDEMDLIDSNRASQSVALPDGGYFGTITAIHELHCLKRLYQFMYPAYYFVNISAQEAEDNRMHNGHCIDILRQSIMCHADISPVTMRWGSAQPIPLGNFSSPHECTNWDGIESWAKKRQIPRLMEPGWLKHPSLGAVYHEGFQNKIGQVHDG
ncbi:hypothetical protein HYFRA_00010332 [Hymenoscyphus fraxineus]|uniref:Tat pathway signal sequence n=1 Tax=Hymenoscyphus fraxineus TaxID=746836 RepID=A0A9N9KW66_9HELO|nr:hypothetical protein HYFRA_00010332 [Hymenoscyphus fraxineus]